MFKRRRRHTGSRVLAVLLLLALTAGLTAACGGRTGRDESKPAPAKLVIASQNYAEPQILSEMVKQLLEAKLGVTVEHKRNFQGSTAVHQALETGDVQMYNSYTGTQFTGILGMQVTDEWKDRRKVYEYVRDKFHEKYGIKVFEPYGFNNTYTLAVRRATAEKLNLKRASDLVPHAPKMTVATDPTFQERKGDGYDDLARTYGFKFKKVAGMAYDLMYQALKAGDVDVAVAYSTDGRLPAFDLVALEDDRHFFPPYDAVFFIKEETLRQFPRIEEIMKPLIGAFTEEEIAKLNQEVDVKKREPAEVAREYLTQKGLL